MYLLGGIRRGICWNISIMEGPNEAPNYLKEYINWGESFKPILQKIGSKLVGVITQYGCERPV